MEALLFKKAMDWIKGHPLDVGIYILWMLVMFVINIAKNQDFNSYLMGFLVVTALYVIGRWFVIHRILEK